MKWEARVMLRGWTRRYQRRLRGRILGPEVVSEIEDLLRKELNLFFPKAVRWYNPIVKRANG
jgi:hypothetical protein